MLRLVLAAAVISLLAACSGMSRDTSTSRDMRTPSRAGATMGAPGDMNADWPPGMLNGGPN